MSRTKAEILIRCSFILTQKHEARQPEVEVVGENREEQQQKQQAGMSEGLMDALIVCFANIIKCVL